MHHFCIILDPLSCCFQCWKYLKMRGCDSECRVCLIDGFGIIRTFSCDTMVLSFSWTAPPTWTGTDDLIEFNGAHDMPLKFQYKLNIWLFPILKLILRSLFQNNPGGRWGPYTSKSYTNQCWILWHFCEICEALGLSNAVAPWLPFIAFASVLCRSEVWIAERGSI